MSFKEFQIIRAYFKRVLDTVFQIIFSKINIPRQVCKSNLWLDHPEFAQVPSGMRVFGTKGGAKCVNIGQRAAMRLHIELTTDSKICSATKEIIGIIYCTNDPSLLVLLRRRLRCFGCCFLSFLLRLLLLLLLQPLECLLGHLLLPLSRSWCGGASSFRNRLSCFLLLFLGLDIRQLNICTMVVRSKQRRDTKLFTSTFTIRTGYNGRMNVQKTIVVEKFVRCKRHGIAYAHGSGVNLGTSSQVSMFTQMFKGVALLAHRVKHPSNGVTLRVSSINWTDEFDLFDL
mmetsp:Transcript_8910/g.13125  ORF Transcript_8910/g.13125 Transcript_8910/m.13125 type:complete len:286 (-) Transcript_8910:1004-1861(-)